MLVGEQPGDPEDIAGRPFVGPAGVVLDRVLERAGLPRSTVYVTNVVKHFRYTERGKRRIHERLTRWQLSACLPWFEAELEIVRPDALVCLGATAAQALLGREVRIARERGQHIASELARIVTTTTHPSAILRMRDHAEREHAMGLFVDDLAAVAAWRNQTS